MARGARGDRGTRRAGVVGLRLTALDERDLEIVSAALQDAVVRMGSIGFDRTRRRLQLSANRYCWERDRNGRRPFRAPCAVAVDGVTAIRSRGLALDRPETLGVLLSLRFEPDLEPPSGVLTLQFAGEGAIAANVECLDVSLLDLGPARSARVRPDHQLDDQTPEEQD